ncbi:MAG: hypothetical protein V4689_17215 [Verrucomicrobiota bacterium]
MNLPFYLSANQGGRLIGVGLLCTGYVIYLIKRGIEGDTLYPGTTFTYLPRWLFIGSGILLQLPLPLAFWFLHWTKSS